MNDHNEHPLSKERLADFFQLHWSFVVDLDAKTEFGLYENAPSHVKSSTRIITDNLSEVSGTSNLTNWILEKEDWILAPMMTEKHLGKLLNYLQIHFRS